MESISTDSDEDVDFKQGEVVDVDNEKSDLESLEGEMDDVGLSDDNVSEHINALKLEKHTKSVFSIDIDLEKQLIITGGEDDVAFVWKIPLNLLETPNTISLSNIKPLSIPILGHSDSLIFTKFNVKKDLFATVDMSGKIKIFSTFSEELKPISSNDNNSYTFTTNSLSFFIKGLKTNLDYDLTNDISVAMWHPFYPTVMIFGMENGEIALLNFDLKGREVKSKILSDGQAQVKVTAMKVISPLITSSQHPSEFVNPSQMVAGYSNGDIKLWDLKSCNCLLKISGKINFEDNHLLSSQQSQHFSREIGHSHEITCLEYYLVASRMPTDPFKFFILSSDLAGEILLHDSHSGKCVGQYVSDEPKNSMEFEGSVASPSCYDDERDKCLQEKSVESLEFCPNPLYSDLFFSADLSGDIKIWQYGSRKLRSRLHCQAGIVKAQWLRPPNTNSSPPYQTVKNQTNKMTVDALSSSMTIISAHLDGSLRVWDAMAGIMLTQIDAHTDVILDFVISADNHWVATCSEDCTSKLIPIQL